MHILSMQSHVVLGHVGNAAAVFPLQRLGADVSAIHTVQFSNHTGYGAWTGAVFPASLVGSLVDGVAQRGALSTIDAVLSGYVGDPTTGDAILDAVGRVRAARPDALYGLDPVFGDTGPGVYARPGIVEFFRDRAIAAADLLTPNHFELATLTGMPAATLAGAKAAIAILRAGMRTQGPRAVLVTSVADGGSGEAGDASAIDLLVAADGAFHRIRTPRLPIAVSGAGDMIAALFLFHVAAGRTPAEAATRAASAVWGVIRATREAGRRELALVAAQDEIVSPSRLFTAEPC